jgi:hypothetical protein
MSSGGAISPDGLAAEHPNLRWVAANADSPESGVVSLASESGVVTIAVGAPNAAKICAFGRWAPPSAPEYVTMSHVAHCRAEAAPAVGWSPEPGGAAFDLPDEGL